MYTIPEKGSCISDIYIYHVNIFLFAFLSISIQTLYDWNKLSDNNLFVVNSETVEPFKSRLLNLE